MGNTEKPKQFLEFAGKPILIHTAERFAAFDEFEEILILTPEAWIGYTQDLLRKYLPDEVRYGVLAGGSTRNETVMNGIRHIEEKGELTEETVVVTHDCVRPLVTGRIIRENILGGQKYTACNTVVPATDTIMVSRDGDIICEIPDRAYLYQSQTPQTFKAKMLKACYEKLSNEEKDRLTDACKICVLQGIPVHMIQGDAANIKITYAQDLKVAEALYLGHEC